MERGFVLSVIITKWYKPSVLPLFSRTASAVIHPISVSPRYAWEWGCSVQFSRSVVSDSLQPHGLQHTRPPCPSPTPGACSNSCPLSQWCHPTISSSVIPFSSHFQSLPASESFPMSQFFTSGSQSIRVSASVISPCNEYSGLISFRIDWLDLLAVQGTPKSLLQHHSSKASILRHSVFIIQLPHPYMTTTRKTIALIRRIFCNMLSKLVITFHPRNKPLLISWLQSPSAVSLKPKKIKSVTVSIISPSICHEVMGPTRCHDLSFLNVEF